MFKRILFKTIGEIKEPAQRLSILQLMAAVFTLAGVVYFLYRAQINDLRQENAELKTDLRKLQHQVDSLGNAVYIVYKEMYEANLKIKNQREQSIRNLKENIKK